MTFQLRFSNRKREKYSMWVGRRGSPDKAGVYGPTLLCVIFPFNFFQDFQLFHFLLYILVSFDSEKSFKIWSWYLQNVITWTISEIFLIFNILIANIYLRGRLLPIALAAFFNFFLNNPYHYQSSKNIAILAIFSILKNILRST